MLHAVIMAGGVGTRFWPSSRVAKPKQLLELSNGESMLQATVRRIEKLIPTDRTLIVTNQQLIDSIAAQLTEIAPESIIGEPAQRNTAPAIGLAAVLVRQIDEEATMIVMPADHIITPNSQFCAAANWAADLVEEQPSRIVTFGIRPTYPAESFGYIERDTALAIDQPEQSTIPTFTVKRFREKPAASVAKDYLAAGRFYWNSGIFVWKARTILRALETLQPEMYSQLDSIAAAIGKNQFPAVLAKAFHAIDGKSIDYAVMEHYHDILVVEAPFQWDDVGSWQSLARIHGSDENGNTVIGKHLGVETQGCIVRSDGQHLVATIGMKNCIIVHTPDATLIANKSDEEGVRRLVTLIKENGWTDYL
ncbi:MAG: mannose-1-phosphate guanylyltransferase [Pirellulaceae bacterium]|nr:mannose-1-phosphate guanylyltransferase [Pirellulaceae bacterium]